jgi:exosortase/archaeosortase family protein
MPDALEFSDLSIAWVAVIIFAAAVFGSIGYVIASRRIKQPGIAFIARFAVSFLLLILIEGAILSVWPSVHEKLGGITATVAGGIISITGVTESVSGTEITVYNPFLIFSVDVACLGGMLYWAYIGLVVAESRATIRQRLTGIVLGLLILLGFNFFRITSSIYLQWLTNVHVHDYFYIVNMVFVLLVWAGWLRILKPKPVPVAKAPPHQGVISKAPGD